MKQVTKEKFEHLYKKHTIQEICKILECSSVTVYRNAKKLGLSKKTGKPLIKDI